MTGAKSSKLLVRRYVLAPDAPLNPPVDGRDALIVGMNNGELVKREEGTTEPRQCFNHDPAAKGGSE